jgi:hypothetical protein
MIFCCFNFDRSYQEKKLRIRYKLRFKELALGLPGGGGYQTLFYCFCCGKKFSQSLRDMWFTILTEEYQIEDPWEAAYEGKVPPEFLTDEWWKKRGL